MRAVGHRLRAASHNDIGVTSHDGLGSEDNCFDTRRAHFVDRCAHSRVVETRSEGALAGRVLSKAGKVRQRALEKNQGMALLCREDVAEENLLYILRLDLGHSFEGGFMQH